MEFNAAFGRVSTLLSVLVLLWYAFWHFRSVTHPIRSQLVRWCGRLSRRDGPLKHADDEMPKMDGEKPSALHTLLLQSASWEQLAMKRRVEYSLLLLRVMVHVGAGLLGFLLVSTFISGFFSESYEGVPAAEDTLSLVAVLVALGIFFVAHPHHFTFRRRDVVHILAIARLAWQVQSTDNPYVLVFRRYPIFGLRIALSIIEGNLPLSVVLNTAFSALSVWRYFSLVAREDGLPDKLFVEGHHMFFIFDEVWNTMVLSAVCYMIETRIASEARVSARMRVSKRAEVTLQSILASVCDAILHVSEDFTILMGSSSLNALLLRAGGREVAGSNFMDVVAEEDRDRLTAHYLEPVEPNAQSRPHEVADWTVIRMVDVCGVRVTAQLFHCRLIGAGDEPLGFLLGIRELSVETSETTPRVHNVMVSDPKGASGTAARGTVDNHLHANLLPVVQHSEDETSSSDVVFWFRADDLTILRGTAAFAALCGPMVGDTCFADWIINKTVVLPQVQEQINLALYENEFGTHLTLPNVFLRNPSRKQIEHNARCTFSVEKGDLEHPTSIDNVVVKAYLDGIRSFSRDRGRRRDSGIQQESLKATPISTLLAL